jgi:hypothetical protein
MVDIADRWNGNSEGTRTEEEDGAGVVAERLDETDFHGECGVWGGDVRVCGGVTHSPAHTCHCGWIGGESIPVRI